MFLFIATDLSFILQEKYDIKTFKNICSNYIDPQIKFINELCAVISNILTFYNNYNKKANSNASTAIIHEIKIQEIELRYILQTLNNIKTNLLALKDYIITQNNYPNSIPCSQVIDIITVIMSSIHVINMCFLNFFHITNIITTKLNLNFDLICFEILSLTNDIIEQLDIIKEQYKYNDMNKNNIITLLLSFNNIYKEIEKYVQNKEINSQLESLLNKELTDIVQNITQNPTNFMENVKICNNKILKLKQKLTLQLNNYAVKSQEHRKNLNYFIYKNFEKHLIYKTLLYNNLDKNLINNLCNNSVVFTQYFEVLSKIMKDILNISSILRKLLITLIDKLKTIGILN